MIRKRADNDIATFLAIDEDNNPLIFYYFFKVTKITFSFFVLKNKCPYCLFRIIIKKKNFNTHYKNSIN